MNKKESLQIMESIKYLYPNFDVFREKHNLWHRFLAEEDFDEVMNQLERHARQSEFIPTVAGLLPPKRAVPKADKVLEEMQRDRENASGPPPIEEQVEHLKDGLRQAGAEEHVVEKRAQEFLERRQWWNERLERAKPYNIDDYDLDDDKETKGS